MPYVNFEPDARVNTVSVETLVAGTNKQITFPAGANAVHVENLIAAPVFFKLDAAFTGVPAGGTYEAGGFFKGSWEGVRKFSEELVGSGHTLNLISSGAGSVVVEFLVL
jgi:hypothetical protein